MPSTECLTPHIDDRADYTYYRCNNCVGTKDCIKAEARELTAPVVFILDDLRITVLQGFCHDGASIPRAFWTLIGHPHFKAYLRAAILHDALYCVHIVSRLRADKALRTLILADGGAHEVAELMYKTVRKAGGIAWEKTAEEEAYWRRWVKVEQL